MSEDTPKIPHLVNDVGLPVIRIGARAFKCVGATPPHDHPHIFLEMGSAEDIVCPYCATRYLFDASLDSTQAYPPEAIMREAHS